MRRTVWPLIAAVVLLVLLAVLGTLQYRWLGAVSEAERERMRTGLRARAMDLARDFNGELTRIYAAFRADTAGLDAEPATALAAAYARWRESAPHPGLVKAIYLVEAGDPSVKPKRFDVSTGDLTPIDWPPELRGVLHRPFDSPSTGALAPGTPPIGTLPPPLFLVDAVNAQIPALVIAVPHITRTLARGRLTVITNPVALARSIVIVLDNDRLVHDLVEPLVAKQFGDPATSDYVVTVVRRDDAASVVFKSSAAPDRAPADVSVGLFDLRMDELARMAEGHDGALPQLTTKERVAITIVRRGGMSDGRRMISTGGDEQGAWLLRVRHRSGSLDAMVAASRRRNVAVGLGILGLLAASVGLVIVSAQRQQRLARQQMEFVAAVSHELRTPLAVIRSAGENLADGVVADAAQVKRYGTLIEGEGRRLQDMVDRVMTFAGISSGAPMRPRSNVDVARIVADAVAGAAAAAGDRRVAIAPRVAADVPAIAADADALRSAVQNLIDNAVKYSIGGGTVDVAVDPVGLPRPWTRGIRIQVIDRGVGIDASDLPHVFEPFFRGRRAIDSQVRGSGIGLSVVKRVADAHHGDVKVESDGRGTTVTLTLPVLELHDKAAAAAAASDPGPAPGSSAA